MTKKAGLILGIIVLIATGCQREVRPLSARGDLDQVSARRIRVVFLIDISESMKAMDPFSLPDLPSVRQREASKIVTRLSRADAAFGFILFNWWVHINANFGEGFVSDPEVIDTILPRLSQATGSSDWQSAIEAGRQMIQQDLDNSSAADIARTTYDLVFLVDGGPSIICDPTCEQDDGGVCPLDLCVPCDAGRCSSEATLKQLSYDICYTPRSRWCESPAKPVFCETMKTMYPFLKQCEPYNTKKSLEGLAADIAALSMTAQIRLHTVLLSSLLPAEVNDGIREALTGLAAAGKGTYVEVKDPEQLNFIQLLGL